MGKVQPAAHYYNEAIRNRPGNEEAWLNLAGLHHRWGDVKDAIRCYRKTLTLPTLSYRLQSMTWNNLGLALTQTGEIESAVGSFRTTLSLLDAAAAPGGVGALEDDGDTRITTHAHLARARKVVGDWEQYDSRMDALVHSIERQQMARGGASALLPFDTLHLPVHPLWTLRVARRHSGTFDHFNQAPLLEGFPRPSVRTLERQVEQRPAPAAAAPVSTHVTMTRGGAARPRLKLAYLSYDFNDHPTAHLVEGLFAHHRPSRVNAVCYNYGKDDGSSYRKHIAEMAHGFVELSDLSHIEAATRIAQHQAHILIDMQGHTRGGRPEIAAHRPTPVVVNYLVFAGTMGASWIDYLVSDRVQTPGELAHLYQEKLVLMPHTYQVTSGRGCTRCARCTQCMRCALCCTQCTRHCTRGRRVLPVRRAR
jgi:protein O-GlcNAc transferase